MRANPAARTARILAYYYLLGRDDADEEFDAEDFAAGVLALRALSGSTKLHEICRSAVQADLDRNALNGTEREWFEENDDDLQEDAEHGIDPMAAWNEWRAGYLDQASMTLAILIADEMREILDSDDDEDTGVETPRAKKRAATTRKVIPNPVGDGPSYGAWYADGMKDCVKSWDETSMDDEIQAAARRLDDVRTAMVHSTAVDLAAQAVADYWEEQQPEGRRIWEADNADDVRGDGLDVDRAYQMWADGWRDQARQYTVAAILRRVG